MSGRLDAPQWRSSPPGGDNHQVGERPLDRFAALVARLAADPDNAYNVDRFLWVLAEPPPATCASCGTWFWPGESYDGGPARGLPRRHCSPRCAVRAAELRRRWRRHRDPVAEQGWAA